MAYSLQPLQTKVFDPQGHPLSVCYAYEKAYQGIHYYNLVTESGLKMGYITLSSQGSSAFIEYMETQQPTYKKVGTALHEIAVRVSKTWGKNGHLMLDTYSTAAGFHYKCGFRYLNPYGLTTKCSLFERIVLDRCFKEPTDENLGSLSETEWYKENYGNKEAAKVVKELFVDRNNLLDTINVQMQSTTPADKLFPQCNFNGKMHLAEEKRLFWLKNLF